MSTLRRSKRIQSRRTEATRSVKPNYSKPSSMPSAGHNKSTRRLYRKDADSGPLRGFILPSVDEAEAPFTPRAAPSHAKKRPGSHIPRPPNSYMIFRAEFAQVNCQNPRLPKQANATSHLAGAIWRGFTTAQRRPYEVCAARVKVEHTRMHPSYKFAPMQRKHGARGSEMQQSSEVDHVASARLPVRRSSRRRTQSTEARHLIPPPVLTSERVCEGASLLSPEHPRTPILMPNVDDPSPPAHIRLPHPHLGLEEVALPTHTPAQYYDATLASQDLHSPSTEAGSVDDVLDEWMRLESFDDGVEGEVKIASQ